MSNRTVFIEEQTLQDIANTIRLKTGSNDTFLPSEMPAAVTNLDSAAGLDANVTIKSDDAQWVRPSEWPNIQQIPIDFANDEDVVYMLYDNCSSHYDNTNLGWAGILFSYELENGSSQAQITLSYGTIQNGAFVEAGSAVSSIQNAQAYSGRTAYKFPFYVKYGSMNSDYVVVKAKMTGSHFMQFWFTQIPAATIGNSNGIWALQNKCLERYGNLPWLRIISSYATANLDSEYTFGCSTLENDVIRIGKYANITDCRWAYVNCYNLRNVDFSGWSTSNWTVDRLDNMFYNCYNLRHLDLSSWNTSGWVCVYIGSMFNNCYKLHSVDFSGWNTTNWAVDSLGTFFSNCYSLEEADLSSWDTTNWNITSTAWMFNNCRSLKRVNLSWNTSNWHVTNLRNMFYNCFSLKQIDLHTWDTSNWQVQELMDMFNNCQEANTINLSGWDTSNWQVTKFTSTFKECISLKHIIGLENFITSGWVVSEMYDCFYNCKSLPSLNLSGWDVSNWPLTNIGNIWNGCSSLSILNISNWDVSNWRITNFGGAWARCEALESIDIENWNVSGWQVNSNFQMLCQDAHNLRKFDISKWPMSGWTITGFGGVFNGCFNLSSVNLGDLNVLNGVNTNDVFSQCHSLKEVITSGIHRSINLNGSPLISREAAVEFMSQLPELPQGSSNNNINFHANTYFSLSEADMQIAINKNWTVTKN